MQGDDRLSDQEQSLIWQTAERILQDLADDASKSESLWTALVENGLSVTWVPEELGGVGCEVADAYDVIRLAGRYAALAPLVEMLIAGRLLALGGQSLPDGTLGVVPGRPGAREPENRHLSVPFADQTDVFIICCDAARVAFVARTNVTTSLRENDIGSERRDITIAGAAATSAFTVPTLINGLSRLDIEGAVARAIQVAGALEAVLSISVQYAREREAFGRPIAKFQAVQHMLAQIAEEVAAALTAALSAADTLASPPDDEAAILLEVASAKIRVSEAADKAMKLAHQVHGAIGITNDYRLQRYARMVIGCRDDFGSPAQWAQRLGEVVAARGGRAIWPTLTTR